MSRERPLLCGRDDELSDLDSALSAITGHRHSLAVVRGTPGIGKTALLAVAADRWRAEGVTVIEIPFRDGVEPWDAFGVKATIAALKRHFEQVSDFSLADAVGAVARLCTPESYASPKLRSGLLIGLAKIFGRLRRNGPVAVIADDVDVVANPTLAITPACLPGCLVVAACRDDGRFAAAPVQLAQLADHLIDLGPLPDEQAGPLLAQRIGGTPDDSLLIALGLALGPLVSDPGALLSTVDELAAAGRIATVHGKTCLAGDEPILLPRGHDLVGQVHRLGTEGHELLVLAATGPAFGVDDLPALAAATGRELTGYGRAVDILVAVGALVCTESGELGCTCPALAGTVLAGTRQEAARLHGKLATHLLATGGERAAIACHVVEAGREIAPSPSVARLLVAAADEITATDPERAARWYQAALGHYDSGDPDIPRVMSTLVPVLTGLGHFGQLAELAAEYPEYAGSEELSDAAALADPLAWHEQRLTGETLNLADILPAGYGIPVDGPLAHYHRVLTGYTNGDWQDALSAARALSLTAEDGPAHRIAGLLAAEICTAQGDLKQASAWLESTGEDERFTALRGWVESGLLAATGDGARALAAGWWAYRSVPGGWAKAGGDRLLARLAVVATDAGQDERAHAVLAEMTDLDASERTPATRAALLFVRGVVTGDEENLTEAAGMAADRGHLPELLMACLALGERAGEPRRWLHQAHELAVRANAAPARAQAKALMRRRGVAIPRSAEERTTLSDMELRIVGLIRDGRTNRQVAVALRITEKTVEYYLSRLFVKTGCRSRIDLAAASARGQLAAASA
jgi:DNA-binding CsgD family transcriptional regulator